MSLARTALRLASIEALKASPVIAALCQDRVYDSLIEEFDSSDPVPLIVVLTEEDGGKAFSANNGGPPFSETCDMVLEIAVRQIVLDPADPDEARIATPETDRELDAAIDLIEWAAVEAVSIADTPQSRLVRQAVTRRLLKFNSVRFTSDATGVKLAVREVRLTFELKGEDRVNPLDIATGPFATLPDPLRTVAAAMPSGSSAAKTCLMIADAIAGETPQPFAGVVAWHAIKRPSYPPMPPLPTTDENGPDPLVDFIPTSTAGDPCVEP